MFHLLFPRCDETISHHIMSLYVDRKESLRRKQTEWTERASTTISASSGDAVRTPVLNTEQETIAFRFNRTQELVWRAYDGLIVFEYLFIMADILKARCSKSGA